MLWALTVFGEPEFNLDLERKGLAVTVVGPLLELLGFFCFDFCCCCCDLLYLCNAIVDKVPIAIPNARVGSNDGGLLEDEFIFLLL